MQFDEAHDVAESEPALTALCAMAIQPSPIGVTPNRRGANPQQSAGFFKAQLGIEQSPNQLIARLFEFAAIVVAGDVVVKKAGQEFDVLWQGFPNRLKRGIDRTRGF